ncbi:MAG: NAD(P)H-dependent oxidoreductase, partial [Candidatus Dormibacteraceae bacterium]
MALLERLRDRVGAGRPVTVGVVGAGQMGAGLIVQMEHLDWSHVVGVADIDIDRARGALRLAGVPDEEVVVVDDLWGAERAADAGRRVVTKDAELMAALKTHEVVVDATGVPEVGARVAHGAIRVGKHVVMLNVEADVTIGRQLHRMATAAGVVYTGSAGDEYAAAKELVDFARLLGFRLVAAGKGKNNPLDRTATPDRLRARAEAIGAGPAMLASFVDGTKTAVEMTCLANATGLVPDVRGMHGPDATVEALPGIFRPRQEGGILNRVGVVDYAIGVAPGVFVIIDTDDEVVARDLRYLRLGEGPYWTLFRPYHLANLETPLSIARAAVYGDATITPLPVPVAETIAVAKRDLRPGEALDVIGGFTFYGLIEQASVAAREGLLPLGLAEHAAVVAPVRMGDPIPCSAVEIDRTSLLARLREMQDGGPPAVAGRVTMVHAAHEYD